jgi:hypothetical protein
MKKRVEIFLIKNKIGSHVGMMLSFIIFITFVVFVFAVLKPAINIGDGKQTILDDTESKIMMNISTNLTGASISFTGISNPEEKCVTLQNIIAVLNIIPPYRVIIKNEMGETQQAYLYDPTIANIEINRGSTDNTFFRLYESPKFTGLTTNRLSGCFMIKNTEISSDYDIGTVYSGSYAFESMIRELTEQYISNYSSVKESLKISPASEFSFYVILSNGSRIEASQPTNAKNIYAQETPIQYVDKDANIQAGYIITKIW